MAKFPFIGASYRERSPNFDDQRCINLYPVQGESGTAKNIAGLQTTPGLSVFCTLPTAPCRQSWTVVDRCFFVSGDSLYEINSDGTYTLRGALLTSSGAVSMSDNGRQLVIVDGANGYILTLATNVFARITSGGWRGADTVCYIDGYFIFDQPDSGIYYITSLYDGFTIDSLDFASAEGNPDNLVAVAAVHKQLWLLGTASIEVAYNAGTPDFPFQQIQGAFIEYGCAAAQSVATTANTIFWLGKDRQGSGIVFMAEGYQPRRISTFAVEYAIQQYGTLSDAVGYTYQEDGHYFYALNFPSASTTWVYDIGIGEWHERAYFNLVSGEYERHRGQCHTYCFNKHLVGDYVNGKVYEQSLSIYDDAGNPKRWLRACAHLSDDLQYIFYNKFQLDMQVGVGLESGNIQDTDPQVMLQWSDDGGHAWSNEYWSGAGQIGEYKKRVIWRRLGRSRDRIFRVAGMSATKIFLINGHIDTEAGLN